MRSKKLAKERVNGKRNRFSLAAKSAKTRTTTLREHPIKDLSNKFVAHLFSVLCINHGAS